MSDLTDEELERLGDVVRLQPTKNSELGERWGMDSGSDVHGYLEGHLKDYYYRDDNSFIRATPEAAELTGVEPGVVDDENDPNAVPERITVPELHWQVFAVVADHDERSESVVSVLNKVRDEFGADPEAGDVRRALQSLRRKNVVEVIYRTVPTFKLAVPREEVEVVSEDAPPSTTVDDDAEDDVSEGSSEGQAGADTGGATGVLTEIEDEFDASDEDEA